MTKGYLTIAQNSETIDYMRHAYGLALSIKATQTETDKISVMITPGQEYPDKYKEVFDEIIDVPWTDMSSKVKECKFFNEWKVNHITPYDETIKIESDMLLTSSIDHWWDYMSLHDMIFTSKVYDYRHDEITSRACRGAFDSNELPNVYSGMMYFKKDNPETYEFFKLAEIFSKNYNKISQDYLDHTRPKEFDTDTIYALVVKLIQKEQLFLRDEDYPTFVHMKRELMNWDIEYKSSKWIDCVHHFFDAEMNLTVAGYKQTLPFHYHEKAFLTDDTILLYENYLGI